MFELNLILWVVVMTALGLAVPYIFVKLNKPTTEEAVTISLNERIFLPVLKKIAAERYVILCKVPVSEVMTPLPNLSQKAQKKALKRLQGHVFDYLMVKKDNLEVICAIELDDHKFDKRSFKAQDLLLEEFSSAAGLPLLRVPFARNYDLAEIVERLERTIEVCAKHKLENTRSLIVVQQLQYTQFQY